MSRISLRSLRRLSVCLGTTATVAVLCTVTSAQYAVTGPGGVIVDSTGGTYPGTLPTGAFLSSSVVVPASAMNVKSVTLTGLAHSFAGDLQMVLEAPGGAPKYNLFCRIGQTSAASFGFGTNFGTSSATTPPPATYVISDTGAAWPVAAPAAGFFTPGTYVPMVSAFFPSGSGGVTNGPLSSIVATPGVWTLKIYDWASGDVGVLGSWTLAGDGLGLNVDFNAAVGAGAGVPSPAYAGAGVAGTWNDVAAGAFATPLVELSGAPTTVTISDTGGAYAFDNLPTLGDDQALLDDVSDPSPSGTVSLAGLPNGTYEVIVYAWAPDDRITFLTDVTVVGGLAGTQTCGGAVWTGAHVEGVTYVKDTVRVAANSITINTATNVGFSSVNGLQVRLLSNALDSQNYCASGTSVNGCVPVMSSSPGGASLGGSGYVLSMTGADPNRNAGMVYSLAPAMIPFGFDGGDFLCNATPRQRLFNPLANTGAAGACGGSITLTDLQGFLSGFSGELGEPFVAGNTIYVQGFFRDAASIDARRLTTSDGLKVVFTP